jgi:hypothetical protein
MRIAEVSEEKLAAVAELDGGSVRARIAGTASARDVTPLERFCDAIHGACAAGGVTAVELDLRKLAYVSSSHLKVLVSWIGKMRVLPARVELRFVAEPRVHWQRRSLPALVHLADDLITIVGMGPGPGAGQS